MPRRSRYVLAVDNVSSITSSRDIEREFDFAGHVRDVVRDAKARFALVEFDRSGDAEYAWKKMDGFKMDGRSWRVEFATRDDFKFFNWKWFEDSPPRSHKYSRGGSPGASRSQVPSQPRTPYGNEDRREASVSDSDRSDRS